jgi:hypothetical protein
MREAWQAGLAHELSTTTIPTYGKYDVGQGMVSFLVLLQSCTNKKARTISSTGVRTARCEAINTLIFKKHAKPNKKRYTLLRVIILQFVQNRVRACAKRTGAAARKSLWRDHLGGLRLRQ